MTEIKITRRIALDIPYEYYELEIVYDSANEEGNKVVKEIEKTVKYIRKLTAIKEPKQEEEKKPTKKKRAAPKETEKIEETMIKDLEDGDKKLNLNVRFGEVGDVRSFTKSDGTKGLLCKIPVEDESGDRIILTAWDKQTADAQAIKKNAWVFLQAAYVTEYKNTLELNVGNWSKMEVKYNGPDQ